MDSDVSVATSTVRLSGDSETAFGNEPIEIVAVNDLTDNATLATCSSIDSVLAACR